MSCFLIFLLLTACTAPRAEAKKENEALNPPSYAVSQSQAVTDSEPLGGETLEAQITEDFKPYLKYFSREKLYPSQYIRNGKSFSLALGNPIPERSVIFKNAGKIFSYTNQYGVEFFEDNFLLIFNDEATNLPYANLGFTTLYRALTENFSDLYVSKEHFMAALYRYKMQNNNTEYPLPYNYKGEITLEYIFYWMEHLNTGLFYHITINSYVNNISFLWDDPQKDEILRVFGLSGEAYEKTVKRQLHTLSLVLPIDNVDRLKVVLVHSLFSFPPEDGGGYYCPCS